MQRYSIVALMPNQPCVVGRCDKYPSYRVRFAFAAMDDSAFKPSRNRHDDVVDHEDALNSICAEDEKKYNADNTSSQSNLNKSSETSVVSSGIDMKMLDDVRAAANKFINLLIEKHQNFPIEAIEDYLATRTIADERNRFKDAAREALKSEFEFNELQATVAQAIVADVIGEREPEFVEVITDRLSKADKFPRVHKFFGTEAIARSFDQAKMKKIQVFVEKEFSKRIKGHDSYSIEQLEEYFSSHTVMQERQRFADMVLPQIRDEFQLDAADMVIASALVHDLTVKNEKSLIEPLALKLAENDRYPDVSRFYGLNLTPNFGHIPPLPKEPLAKFVGGRGSMPIEFAIEHYGTWIEAGLLDLRYLDEHYMPADVNFYEAVKSQCRKNKRLSEQDGKEDRVLSIGDLFPSPANAKDARDRISGSVSRISESHARAENREKVKNSKSYSKQPPN